jgi:pyridinium-3,5-biscarboxylic acid mononucleotide synthase
MHPRQLTTLLRQVKNGKLSIEQALERLRDLPFEDLGFAKLDHHRALRTGFPEVVYCPGKKPEQIVKIVERLAARNKVILASRAAPEVYQALAARFPKAVYHETARMVVIGQPKLAPKAAAIAVVSAGTADLPVAEEAAVTAEAMGRKVERLYDVGVAGLHRLLTHKETLFRVGAIVVVAGMEGALASVVGGLVEAPVIAVPTSVGYGAAFQGLAALLTMLNSCAVGVTVVNIDNGFGAGYFAALITRPATSR